jgi:hypothetical protein
MVRLTFPAGAKSRAGRAAIPRGMESHARALCEAPRLFRFFFFAIAALNSLAVLPFCPCADSGELL